MWTSRVWVSRIVAYGTRTTLLILHVCETKCKKQVVLMLYELYFPIRHRNKWYMAQCMIHGIYVRPNYGLFVITASFHTVCMLLAALPAGHCLAQNIENRCFWHIRPLFSYFWIKLQTNKTQFFHFMHCTVCTVWFVMWMNRALCMQSLHPRQHNNTVHSFAATCSNILAVCLSDIKNSCVIHTPGSPPLLILEYLIALLC